MPNTTRKVNINPGQKLEIYCNGVLLTRVMLGKYNPQDGEPTVLIDTSSQDEFGVAFNGRSHDLLSKEN